MVKVYIDYTAIGQRIKLIRKQKKYTQEKLAEYLNCSFVYISQIENGKTKISLEMLLRISHLLATDPCFFINGTTHPVQEYLQPDIARQLQTCSTKKRKMIHEVIKLIAECKE